MISSEEHLDFLLLRGRGRRSALLERGDDESGIGVLGQVFGLGDVVSAAAPAPARYVEELL